MPFARPTLDELIRSIRHDLRGKLEINGPLLRRAMVDALAAVWAGVAHGLYGYLAWIARQLFADQADKEMVLRKAALYDITPVPATFATGLVGANGADGSVILQGEILKLDSVTRYRVVTGQTITSGYALVPVIAVEAGAAGNLPEGATLTFESPLTGVDATAVVASDGIAGGVDQEDEESVRARLLQRLREPPQGGAAQDYIAWARAVAGVTRAWVNAHEQGLGTVVVRFVNDDGTPIFPDAAAVAAVQAALDAERPITAQTIALAPTPLVVPLAIHLVPDNGDTRTAVAANLRDLFERVAEPGDGAGRGAVLLSKLRTAIDTATGVADYTLLSPTNTITPGLGQLAILGAITWS